MPCNSDYLEPTAYEREVQNTAKILLWFIGEANINYKGTQIRIKKVAKDSYPSKEDGNFVVSLLCKELRNLKAKDEAKFDEIVYGRNKEARELANWWEDHEKADNKRVQKDLERRSKEWMEVYNGSGANHLDSPKDVITLLIGLGYEAPVKSTETDN